MAAWSIMSVFMALVAIILTSVLIIFLYFKRTFTYWRRHGVIGPEPSIPFGNYSEIIKAKKSQEELFISLYNKYKQHKYFGIYLMHKPILMVTDLEVANRMLVTDFQHFESHGSEANESIDPLSMHLFNLTGKPWKDMRMKLTPVFSSGKIKAMFLIMEKIGTELQNTFKVFAEKNQEVEIQDIVARFTTDVIGNCAFGVDCNSLQDEEAPFRKYGRRIFAHKGLEGLKLALGFFFPEICDLLKVSPQKPDVTEFIFNSIRETLKYREENNVKRNDFLDLLIDINKGVLKDDAGNAINTGEVLTENEFMSQVYLFFVAGFETSSSLTSFALYELACNPLVQQKAREEVRAVLKKYNGQYTYDAMLEMDYISNISNETLRKYPQIPMVLRKCTKTYQIPDTNVKIEKGVFMFVPNIGMNMDPEFFPDPENFNPDRFKSENKHPLLSKIFMPFGQGPRLCIGMRFGLMQSKVALAKVLEKYQFSVGENTLVPMQMKKGFNTLVPVHGNWLKIDPV